MGRNSLQLENLRENGRSMYRQNPQATKAHSQKNVQTGLAIHWRVVFRLRRALRLAKGHANAR